ncbi:MAG: DUF2846 domain-containing protein [Polyangia bacterium]|nr:DUF2846 domain-containing protein [Polyangia bacterium]
MDAERSGRGEVMLMKAWVTLRGVKISGLVMGMACAGVLCSACPATVAAPSGLDVIARNLSPPPGHALLYVIRPEFMGQAVRFDVLVNGTWIGATGGFRYLFTYLRPGHYLIQSRAENVAELRLTVRAGQIYFVEQRPRMGIFMPGNDLVLMPEAVGRRKMRLCSLSGAMPREVLAYAQRLGHAGTGHAGAGHASPGAAPNGGPGAGVEGRGAPPQDAPPGAKGGGAKDRQAPPEDPRQASPGAPPPPSESF